MTDQEALEKWPDELLRERKNVVDYMARRDHLVLGSPEYEQERADKIERERGRLKKQSEDWEQRHNTMVPDENGGERHLVGGAQPGSGRPKQTSLTERVVDAMSTDPNQRKMVRALEKALTTKDDPRVGLQAVRTISQMESKVEELKLKKGEQERKPEDELRAGLAMALARLEELGKVNLAEIFAGAMNQPEIVDGTVVEENGDSGEARAGELEPGRESVA